MGLLNYIFGIPTNLIAMPEGFDILTVTFKSPDTIVVCYGKEDEVTIIRETIKELWKGQLISLFHCTSEPMDASRLHL